MQNGSSDTSSLEYLFHPKSIAIAGGAYRQLYLEALLYAGFKGRIYPLSRDAGEINGLKTYHSIKDIPDTVDYVISAIPASATPQLIEDCALKGVKAIHMFTAGFSEISDKRGQKLQSEIVAIARQKGIRIIGPNCMGLYCPKTGLSFHPDVSKESGSVAFLSQSGGNAIWIIREGNTKGINFSKVISYGNASDLNEIDFLEYLTHDPDTEVITVYVEGVSDGPRFFKTLKEAAKVKPVILYKGGTTDIGTRAVASHTGALAGSERVWSALIKQAGAIQVYGMDELLDMVLLFRYMSPPKGKATCVIGIGGGNSVYAADVCANAGLEVPLLPPATRGKLNDIYSSEAGASFRNPIDMYFDRWDLAKDTIKLVDACKEIDLILIHLTFGWNPRYEKRIVKPYVDLCTSIRRELTKPVAVSLQVFGLAKYDSITFDSEASLYDSGYPVFTSVVKAAQATNRYCNFHNRPEIKSA